MAKKTFLLEIISPEKVILSEEVDSVVVPGSEGEFQVLPGHTPFITACGIGITVFHKGLVTTPLALSGGYCEVLPEKTTLLVRAAEHAHEIDADRARAACDRAKERMEKSRVDRNIDFERARLSLIRALNRLKASEFKK